LCASCEQRFGDFDHYGIEVLLKRIDQLFHPISFEGQVIAYQAADLDQKLLLQFLLSTLWRASVSTHLFYKRVTLGPYEELLRNMILGPEKEVPKVFAAVLSRWDPQEEQYRKLKGCMMDPFRERWDGVNAFRMYFGPVVAYIKTDQRDFREPLNHLALMAYPTTNIIARSLNESSDLAAMIKTVKNVPRKN